MKKHLTKEKLVESAENGDNKSLVWEHLRKQ